MEIKYKELIGFEGNITELSNKLQALDCEDICYFGNLSELMDDGNIVGVVGAQFS